MRHYAVLGLLFLGFLATPAAMAQSVAECRVITRQVEAAIDWLDQRYFDEGIVQHVKVLQQQALHAAAKGNGRRCFKLARQAQRVANRSASLPTFFN
ncbi:MAG: hypothetical protein AAGF59_10750 [Pseudomonadota bacterium]